MCLVHNIPGNLLNYLASTGNTNETKNELLEWLTDDDYPLAFCNLALKVITEGIQWDEGASMDMPMQMAYQVSLMIL